MSPAEDQGDTYGAPTYIAFEAPQDRVADTIGESVAVKVDDFTTIYLSYDGDRSEIRSPSLNSYGRCYQRSQTPSKLYDDALEDWMSKLLPKRKALLDVAHEASKRTQPGTGLPPSSTVGSWLYTLSSRTVGTKQKERTENRKAPRKRGPVESIQDTLSYGRTTDRLQIEEEAAFDFEGLLTKNEAHISSSSKSVDEAKSAIIKVVESSFDGLYPDDIRSRTWAKTKGDKVYILSALTSLIEGRARQ